MAASKPPVLGMHLVTPNLPMEAANTVRSLAEAGGCIRLESSTEECLNAEHNF